MGVELDGVRDGVTRIPPAFELADDGIGTGGV
jgi:hypothetical protein